MARSGTGWPACAERRYQASAAHSAGLARGIGLKDPLRCARVGRVDQLQFAVSRAMPRTRCAEICKLSSEVSISMVELLDYPFVFFIFALLVMCGAAYLGARFPGKDRLLDKEIREDFSTVQSASLTLLALVIGFTLSMAVGRYDQRKNYEEEEANAIGTEFLRANLLPSGQAAALQLELKKYLELRLRFYAPLDNQARLQLNAATSAAQNAIWLAAKQTPVNSPNPVLALVVAGANDVINAQGYAQAAWWNRIPHSVWLLLGLLGIFCNFLVGYGMRGGHAYGRFLSIMPLVVALSFLLIADIDSPRKGIIRVAPQNLISLADSIK